jgi:hypothetical protein
VAASGIVLLRSSSTDDDRRVISKGAFRSLSFRGSALDAFIVAGGEWLLGVTAH